MTNTKNKIAYFCPSLSWGGLEMNQLRNAEWMLNRGHKVMIFVQNGSRIHQEAEKLNISVAFVKPHKKYYDFLNAFRLIKKIKQHQVSHLIVRDPRDMSLCALAKSWTFHKFFLAYFMEMQIGIPKRDLIHTLRYESYDLWACPLNWLSEQVKELTKFPKERIKVIPSAMDLSKFTDLPSQNSAREKLELPNDQIIIGLIGRFDPFKGHHLLLDAYEMLSPKLRSKISLAFLGEQMNPDIDDFYPELMKRLKKETFKSNVHILPFRKDVETFYAGIDVFVMASKAETFGMVTIESIAAGTPVIGSNAGGTPELLGEGNRGILFETMNKESLANSIKHFVEDYQFDANHLKAYAKNYDHQQVCALVEENLGL